MRPPITLLSTTYFPEGEAGQQRREVALATYESWRRNLRYLGDLSIHIADDGSDGPVIAPPRWWRSISQQARRGVGASLNAGFQRAFEESPLAAYLVDDWELLEPFDLTVWADLLMEREDIGCVRLAFPHPNIRGSVERALPAAGGEAWFLRLDPYAFAFGHRPALYHRRFIERFGWFEEGVNAFDCEQHYAEAYVRDLQSTDLRGPAVVLALPVSWRHVDSVELGDIVPEGHPL